MMDALEAGAADWALNDGVFEIPPSSTIWTRSAPRWRGKYTPWFPPRSA